MITAWRFAGCAWCGKWQHHPVVSTSNQVLVISCVLSRWYWTENQKKNILQLLPSSLMFHVHCCVQLSVYLYLRSALWIQKAAMISLSATKTRFVFQEVLLMQTCSVLYSRLCSQLCSWQGFSLLWKRLGTSCFFSFLGLIRFLNNSSITLSCFEIAEVHGLIGKCTVWVSWKQMACYVS